MNHKNNRRVQMTKKLFQNALLQLLSTHSIDEISICELCKTADLNRSTFYKYYNSPYDLLEQMKYETFNQITQIFSENNSLSYKEQLIELLNFLLEHEQFSKFVLNTNFESELPKYFIRHTSKDFIIKSITEDSQNEILYKQTFFFYGTRCVIKEWINMENRESPQQLAEIIMKFTHFE